MYKVLWIDDELASELNTLKKYAKRQDMEIVPFEDKKSSMAYFREHHREVDAIILDGLFVIDAQNDDEDIREKALNQCLEEIRDIEKEMNTTFPRIIYSAQTKILGADFEENRGIKVFEKTDDPVEMFAHLREQIDQRSKSHIRKLYSNFATVCDDPIFEGADLWLKFLPQLEAIQSNSPLVATKKVADLRAILDRVSKTLADHQIIPQQITEGSASLTLVSIFIKGKIAELRREGIKFKTKSENPILPTLFCESFRLMLDITGIANHEEWEKDEKLKDHSILEYEELLPNNHLLKTATFIAMDLVIATCTYIKKNPDVEINASKWEELKAVKETKIGFVKNITRKGAAFIQPEGTTDSKNNVMIPQEMVLEHGIEVGIRIKVTAEQQTKGWCAVGDIEFPR